jgi:hypothetical protein
MLWLGLGAHGTILGVSTDGVTGWLLLGDGAICFKG